MYSLIAMMTKSNQSSAMSITQSVGCLSQWEWSSHRSPGAQLASVHSVSERSAAQLTQLINEWCLSPYKYRWDPIRAMSTASVKGLTQWAEVSLDETGTDPKNSRPTALFSPSFLLYFMSAHVGASLKLECCSPLVSVLIPNKVVKHTELTGHSVYCCLTEGWHIW